MIRVTLEVDKINYRKLKQYASAKTSGLPQAGAQLLLSGLDSMDSSAADKAVVKGANAFSRQILNMLNQEISDSGVRFSSISFSE